ncbi:MAG: T9SS type A sorting domain-containing protein [Bacteroidetes bacterium]|nr:T9SS type A sorting domain-containing protein [Bacteroidota bacterium]
MKKLYFLLIVLFIGINASGQSCNGWNSVTNEITNSLKSVYFISADTGYTVGEDGTILKTINGGINWIAQNSGITNNLKSVYFANNSTGYVVGDNGIILKTIDGGNNWNIQISGTILPLYSVCFNNTNIGYAVGDYGKILKTIDGGTNWITQTSGTTQYLETVYFASSDTGFIVGSGGTILKTINGGTNWITQTSGNTNWLYSINFTDANTGYITGESGTILKTINGGLSWVSQISGTTKYLNSVYFINNNVGYIVGNGYNFDGIILKTINGGLNWSIQTNSITSSLNSVFFTDSNKGYTVGNNGRITKTINGGTNWIAQTSDTSRYLSSIYFTDLNTAFAVGSDGGIYKTINGGTNWISQISGTPYGLNSVYFTDYNTGYTVGDNILKTIDGGANWTKQINGGSYSLSSVHFPNANVGYAVGSNGRFLKTTNGGANWTIQTNIVNSYLYSVFFINSDTGFITTSSGSILKTINGGTNWITQTIFNGSLTSVSFTDSNIGYVVGSSGAIFKTTNGGTSWTAQISNTSYPLNSVFFFNSNIGYIVGSLGTILKTTNGGINWTLQNSGTSRNLTSVFFNNADTGYIVGGNLKGRLLKTTQGGNPIILPTSIPNGPTQICIGSGISTYTVLSILNATSYVWSITPLTAGTITGNDTIGTVNWNPAFSGTVCISVHGSNGSCNGNNSLLIVNKYSNTIGGSINGGGNICLGDSTGILTLYGNNGNIIKWQKKMNNGVWSDIADTTTTYNEIPASIGIWSYRAIVQNGGCTTSYSDSAIVNVNFSPVNAGAISGISTVCQGQTAVSYTVPTIANATSYIWTLPNGATGTSTTNIITVNFGVNAVSGNITVKGHSICGDGAPATIAITVNPLPSNAGTISGPTTVYQGQNAVNYTVTAITNATSYIWTLPNGATGTSSTNSITVNYSSLATSGNITVKGANACGDGVISSLHVTVIPNTTNCSAQFNLIADTNVLHHYFIVNNASGLPHLHYNWSWGDGTHDTIAYPSHTYSTAGYYNICQSITDSVGCTATYCDSSYLQKSPNAIIFITVVPQGSLGINMIVSSDKINIYPNPASNKLIIDIQQLKNLQNTSISIYDIKGNLIFQQAVIQLQTELNITDFSKGVYVIKLNNDNISIVNKFVKE